MQDDEKTRREATMRYSIIDGSLWSVMTQAGVSFLTPFALALGAPIMVIGALNAVPPFLDGVSQKIGSHFSDLGWERKKILVWGVAAQALMWLLLSFLAFYAKPLGPQFANTGLVALAALIFFFGGVPNPAWVALMGDVVPEKTRASWFGHRNRMIYFVGVLTLLFAGFYLDSMKADVLLGFSALFAIAFVTRLAGSHFLELHWDPNPKARKEPEAGKEAKDYAVLLFLIFFTVNIAGNYLPVYLLEMLKFDYLSFSAALMASMIFYVLAAPHWGRLIEKYGTKKVLVSAVALNSLSIFITVLVQSPLQALLSYSFAGIIGSGVMVSYLNYLFDITKPEERIKATGHAYLLLGTGTLLGTAAGGIILSYLGQQSINSFYALFIIAGALRIISALIVNARTREVKNPPGTKGTLALMGSILTVYPIKGLVFEISGAASRVKRT